MKDFLSKKTNWGGMGLIFHAVFLWITTGVPQIEELLAGFTVLGGRHAIAKLGK